MSRRDLLTALALFTVAIGYFSLTATRTFDLRDEGYLLGRSAQVAAGAVPHRDFADVYGPGVLATTGLALRLGGGEILAVRALVVLLKAVAVALGFLVARRAAPFSAALFAAGIAIAYWGRFAENLNTPYAALFTIPLAAAAVWLLIDGLSRRTVRRLLFAGVVAGGAILFKQSLGIMLAYGMILALIAVELLAASAAVTVRGAGGSRLLGVALIVGWLLAGLAPILPVAPFLGARDYLLHFLPLHALVACVAVAVWRRGIPPLAVLAARARVSLLPFLAGTVALPLGVCLLYWGWGSLDELLSDMFELPLSLRGYRLPVELPPLSLALWLLGVLALITAGLALLGASEWSARRRALALGLAGVALAVGAPLAIPSDFPRLYELVILRDRAPFALEGVLAPVLMWSALLLVGGRLLRPGSDPPPLPLPSTLLPILFSTAMLSFEVFPRAGHNLWILHGALAPLLAVVLGAWFALARAPSGLSRGAMRGTVAALLVAVVPVWLVAPLVTTVLRPDATASARRPPALRHTRGLALDPRQFEAGHVRELEELMAYLDAADPEAAPLLVLTNEEMIAFVSDRPRLLEDEVYALFLAGWGMLPASSARELDAPELHRKVAAAKDLLVVHRIDPTAANLRRALPELRALIEERFEPVARFGVYRVLRHRDR